MKTLFTTNEKALEERKWVIIDAENQVVGRLASKIAAVLRGKNKPNFAPHTDIGDFVVVVNADKVKFTGQKLTQKKYIYHSGYIGGIKENVASTLLKSKPEEILKTAVRGMLPKTPLGRSQLAKLKVYRGAEHPHAAQNPQVI